ncbi:MAG: ATP-binding protein [Gammaproteobacteria bacterium]|nr:ATP-binding protein [Gammaproteobacteria bacterium]
MIQNKASRYRRSLNLYALLIVVAVIATIETGRRTGTMVPAPFLLIFGSVALVAGLTGLRTGLAAASIAAMFVVYSARQGFGPTSLTGSIFTVITGSSIAFFTAYLLGSSRDKRIKLTEELLASQAALLDARNELEVIVERRTAEVSDLRNRLDSATEYSPAGVLVIDREMNIVSLNPAGMEQLGVDSIPAEWRGFRDIMQDFEMYSTNGERISLGKGPLTDAINEGKVTDRFEFRLVRPDRVVRWYRVAIAPIRSDDGLITGATAINLDISKEKQATEAMRALTQQLMQVQEDERTQLAYELHDEIGQYLTALNLNLHALEKGSNFQKLLVDCIAQVDGLMSTVKNLSVELRPAMLDDLGLVAAVRWYLARQRQRSGLGITFDSNVSLGKLSPEISTACFRVVQEAVTNAISHSGCDALTVRMYNEDGGLFVEISDRGCGFDVRNRNSAGSQQPGLGLLVMRERVSQLGGEFAVESEIGRGTQISACFPLR